MRSDFWSLPWAAQRAIRQGEHNAARAAGAVRDAAYWRNAYEELVKQTGRDLNDGLGLDPRSYAAKQRPKP